MLVDLAARPDNSLPDDQLECEEFGPMVMPPFIVFGAGLDIHQNTDRVSHLAPEKCRLAFLDLALMVSK